MAPSRLEEKLRKLGLSADDSGASRSAPASKTKYMFRIYFPKPPYDGLLFNALKSGSGFNFTGQLLGVGGKQLQRIKQESSARVEVVNAQGNLNGAHPDPLDPDLHALVSADSMSKLHKAAGMVWELLQPVNARFLPIDVVPGGSVRLTVAQPGKAAAKAAAAAQQAANAAKLVQTRSTPATPGGAEAASEEAAAALSRPASVSPSLTPVTPAATACRTSAAFAANRDNSMEATPNSCSSRSCNSPVLTGPGSTSSSSSNIGGLLGTLEGFSLPPAAVPPAASPPSEKEAVTPTAAAKLDAAAATVQANFGAAVGAPAAASPKQQQLQPVTPGIEQGQSGKTVHGGQRSQRADASLAGSSCCVSLPSELMQDLGIAEGETVPRTAHNSSAGTPAQEEAAAAAAAATNPNGASGATPADTTSSPLPTVQKPQQQKQAVSSPVLGPEPSGGSCSSCFQYGLGLCTSSSWDSSVSCSSKESPALQALLVDHQRQQQQHVEHMQLMQLQQHAVGSLGSQGSQGTMQPFGRAPGSGLLAPLVGSFEGESLHLGPGALLQPSGLSRGPSAALEGMLHHRSDAMLVPPTPAAGFRGAAGLADPASFGQHGGLHQQRQQQLQEQQRMLALAAAAGEGLGFGLRAPQGLGGFSGVSAGLPGPAGGLQGSMVGLGWAGAAEMPHAAAVFGTPPAAFADMSMRPMGGGLMMQHQHNSKDAPVWMHHQQEPQQQQHMMMMMMHGQQQGATGLWQEQQGTTQFGGSAGFGLEQPGALSIW